MKREITAEERKKILGIKKKARYRDIPQKIKTHTKAIRRRFRRQRVDILAKAWMAYIDYLGINKYRSKQFNYKKTKGGTQCLYRDNLFTIGERAAITKYLNEHHLIEIDNWHFHRVKWRDKDRKKEKTKEAEEGTQQTTDKDHPEEQPLARIR